MSYDHNDPTGEAPCIKCGVVDVKGKMLPLTAWYSAADEAKQRQRRHIHPGPLAWLHGECLGQYDNIYLRLVHLDLQAREDKRPAKGR